MSELQSGGCDVCVLDNYSGEPSDFCQVKQRKARKPHQCCECGATIKPGEPYEHTVGKWEGEISVFDTCFLCIEIRKHFSCGGGWTFTTIWEDLREELFPRLTTGCLTGLSVEAHEKVLAEWRKWKGLAET